MDDSTPKARQAYFQRLAAMTPAERVQIGVSLLEAGNAMQRAGIRRRKPDATEADIRFEMAVSRFGLDLATRVYGQR